MTKFLLKNLFIHFLVVILIDLPSPNVMSFLGGVVFAAETREDLLNQKIELYNEFISSSNLPATLGSENGRAAMDDVQRFIGDSTNRAVLGSGAGRELLNLHNRFTRYLAMKEKFDECLSTQDTQYTQGLPERLLEAGLSAENSEIPCDRGFFEAASLDDLLGNIRNIVNSNEDSRAEEFHNFQGAMHVQGMKNSARTYLGLEFMYDKSFGGDRDTLSEAEVSTLADKICQRREVNYGYGAVQVVSGCSEAEQAEVSGAIQSEYAKLKASNTQRYSTEEARADVVARVNRINNIIDENEFDTIDTWGEDSINFETEKSQTSYNNYINGYMAEASSGPGLLLWTSEIGETRKDKDANALFGLINGGFNPSTRRFRHHNEEIGNSSIENAIEEAKSRVLDQSTYLIAKNRERIQDWGAQVEVPLSNAEREAWFNTAPRYDNIVANRKESLKDMIRKNPVIAGQVLMQSPEYAQEACDVINGVIQDAKDGEEWSWGDVFLYGGMIVGVGLLAATGVGLLALGAGALGVAGAGALATATLTAATYGGLALGVAEMAYFGPRWATAAREKNEFLSAYLAGGGDEQSAEEFLDHLAEFEDAKLNFMLAAGFSIFDLGAMRTVMRSMGAAERTRHLTNARDFMSYIGGRRRIGRQIRDVTSLMGSGGQARMGRVLRMMSRQPNYREILEHIKTLTPQKAKEVFENGFKVCDELCP